MLHLRGSIFVGTHVVGEGEIQGFREIPKFQKKTGLRTPQVLLESLAHLHPSSSSSMFSFTQLGIGEAGHVYSLGCSLSPSWRTRSGTRHLWIWNGCGWLEFSWSSNDFRCRSSWRCWRSMFRSLALTLRNRLDGRLI